MKLEKEWSPEQPSVLPEVVRLSCGCLSVPARDLLFKNHQDTVGHALSYMNPCSSIKA